MKVDLFPMFLITMILLYVFSEIFTANRHLMSVSYIYKNEHETNFKRVSLVAYEKVDRSELAAYLKESEADKIIFLDVVSKKERYFKPIWKDAMEWSHRNDK